MKWNYPLKNYNKAYILIFVNRKGTCTDFLVKTYPVSWINQTSVFLFISFEVMDGVEGIDRYEKRKTLSYYLLIYR